MSSSIRRLAICTGGGDAPGLDAVIHAAVYAATALKWEVLGNRGGFEGLLSPPDGNAVRTARALEISLGD